MLFFGRKKKVSIHRHYQNKYLHEMCQDLAPNRVLNIGATPDAHDKEGNTYKSYFPKSEFKALDTRPHDHPDYIQGDLVEGITGHGQFDLVLCMSVIEHISKPWIAADKIAELVAPGGYLYIAMPWLYPLHQGPDFGDFWRATPEGIQILFPELEVIEKKLFPTSIFAIRDRKAYWRNKEATAAGSAILLRKQ